MAIQHPRLARVVDAGVDDGQPWLAREWLSGWFLVDELDAGLVSVGRALSLVAAVCAGLVTLHAQELVHGAIRPANVFVGVPGSPRELAGDDVKLVDAWLPGDGPPPTPDDDIEACAALLRQLVGRGDAPEPVATLVARRFGFAAELFVACTACLRDLSPEARDRVPPLPEQPSPPPPFTVPMPTNWSPPPSRPPFRYGSPPDRPLIERSPPERPRPSEPARIVGSPNLTPTTWSPPPQKQRVGRALRLAAAVGAAVVAAGAALWWLLR